MKRRNWSVKLVLFVQTGFYTALGERAGEKVLQCNLHSLSLIIFVAGTLRHCRHTHGLRSRGQGETGQHQSTNTETALEPKWIPPAPTKTLCMDLDHLVLWKQCTRAILNHMSLDNVNMLFSKTLQVTFLILPASLLVYLNACPKKQYQKILTSLVFCSHVSVRQPAFGALSSL